MVPSMLDDRISGPRGATPPNTPHGIEAADACPTCRITAAEFFDRLPRNVVAELQSRTTTRVLAPGDVLYDRGDNAVAMHVLRAGRMKVRAAGHVVKICRAGEVLGGGTVAAGITQAVTLVAIDECRVDTIALAPARLRTSIVATVNTCALAAHRQPRAQAIVLSAETIARLARVLADVGCFAGEATEDGIRVPLTVSHRRIGEMLALPESAVAHIFTELEARGVLYADAEGITILGSMAAPTPVLHT
jgi:CRP-like cAMP-binding protein